LLGGQVWSSLVEGGNYIRLVNSKVFLTGVDGSGWMVLDGWPMGYFASHSSGDAKNCFTVEELSGSSFWIEVLHLFSDSRYLFLVSGGYD
jgi:hypothetical protein